MRIYIYIFFALVFGKNITSYGQTKVVINKPSEYYNIPQEKLYVHLNTTLLLTGEHFYYKVYCLNSETNSLSNISKIVYVELINSDKNQIFKQKVRLESGLGQGDFFIPTSVQSGNYKLIAYTQWMRNKEENKFFQNDISIINPFSENQNNILKNTNQIDTLQIIKSNKINEIASIETNELVALELNTTKFKNREKVVLNIKSNKELESFGNYSVSVRKIEPISIPNKLTSTAFLSMLSQEKKSSFIGNKNAVYLPELRGELLSGNVIFKDSRERVSNAKVALSIPGEDYIFKIANTNNFGVFYFNLDNEYKNSKATIEVINNDGENFEVELDQQKALDYGNLEFNNFWITENDKNIILEHSIFNQIENAYTSLKPDIINKPKPIIPFYGSNTNEYILDDYTRFPTMSETIVEVVNLVYIKQRKGIRTVNVIRPTNTYDSGLLPLILMDGQRIQDHNKLIDFNANKVKKISVVREKYIYGSQLFDGIISLETFEGNFENIDSESLVKNVELFKPLESKSYFQQQYDGSDKLNRIPDFRTQLLWLPNLEINSKLKEVTFFTSDVNGTFEISLEGFTNNGKAVSLKEVIVVE